MIAGTEPTTTDLEELEPDAPAADAGGAGDVDLESDPMTAGLDADELDGHRTERELEAVTPEADGWKKDSMNRWHRRDGTVASKAEVAEREKRLAEQGPDGAIAANAEKANAEAPALLPPSAWRPNVYGQEVELIPGALQSPDGDVFIPRGMVAQATALMARGTKYDEVRQWRQQAAAERDKAVGPLREENAHLRTILENIRKPEILASWGLTDPASLQLMSLEIENALLSGPRPTPGPASQPPAAAQEQYPDAGELDQYDAQQAVNEELADLLATPDFKDVFTPAQVQELAKFVISAYPFTQIQGQHVLDRVALAQLVSLRAETPRAVRAARAAWETSHRQQQVVATAGRRNAAATSPSVAANTTPPRPAPAAAAAASGADDPAYADQPWTNPALSREQKRDLFYQHQLNMKAPGS